MNKLYQQLADVMGTTVKEVHEDDDQTDAGATFANDYNLQIAPYMHKPYILYRILSDAGDMEKVGDFETEAELLEYVEYQMDIDAWVEEEALRLKADYESEV